MNTIKTSVVAPDGGVTSLESMKEWHKKLEDKLHNCVAAVGGEIQQLLDKHNLPPLLATYVLIMLLLVNLETTNNIKNHLSEHAAKITLNNKVIEVEKAAGEELCGDLVESIKGAEELEAAIHCFAASNLSAHIRFEVLLEVAYKLQEDCNSNKEQK